MLPFLRERFGNPSEPHWAGREARAGLEAARGKAAGALGPAAGVPRHVGAVQAAAGVRRPPDELRGEIPAAIAAHKLGGAKGSGLLAGRGVATLRAVLHGGGQERGLRPGTESAALAAG